MKVPLSWLKQYVPIALEPRQLAHILTMAGLEVGTVTTYGESWDRILVGFVEHVAPHPNADRLTLCTVSTGTGSVTVVCGAPNVASGQKIAFAETGAQVINPHTGSLETLKAAQIRGVVSEGMICSEQELGLSANHAGIMVLPDDASTGTPLIDYLADSIIDIDVTPNRPDCLSILGVAREIAALTKQTIREPFLEYAEEGPPIETLTSVEIADPTVCPRYACSVITGVQVGPSPRWLQDRLIKVGQRPINNIVDVTNYVMLEYGQPLHAFDLETLHEQRIIVRLARPGERLTTIDGQDHQLQPSMAVIADAKEAIALGGVMGGASTEVTEQTRVVLLESASFSVSHIRNASRATSMRTEASQRFEKGMRPHLVPIALRRATQMIQEVGGGTIAKGTVDCFPGGETEPKKLTVTLQRLNKILGTTFTTEQVAEVLTTLGFLCQKPQRDGSVQVTVPYWRSDINIEEDLVEEVARIIGYDAIPTTMLSTPIPHQQPKPLREFREQAKDLLVRAGMQEIISYPLTTRDILEKFGASKATSEPLKVANPLSHEQEYLRTTLRGSILSTLAYNLRRQERSLRLFEAGRVFLRQDSDLPQEREMLVGVLAGYRSEGLWQTDDGMLDLYDAKGVIESIFGNWNLRVSFEPADDPTLHWDKAARILVGDVQIGVVGEVHPDILDFFDITLPTVAIFELDLQQLLVNLPQGDRRFRPFPRVPGVTRDLSLSVEPSIPSALVQTIIEGHPMVAKATLFDVYSGDQVNEGQRSLAYRVLFQSESHTLTADEVAQAIEHILDRLKQELNSTLRELH